MKKIVILLLLTIKVLANDSEYYTSGNQLVPLQSNDVRLDKEVLTITHSKDYSFKFKVDVKYQLFNEGEARTTVIGFESVGQVGDAEPESFFENKYDDKKVLNAEKKAIKKETGNYKNEYVTNFKVVANGQKVTYKTANVEAIEKDKYTSPYVGSLYYFPVKLKKGVNTIHQTYHFSGQSSVYFTYEFTYILETAKRWKGGKIKDFTLILDMGDNEEFSLDETFFEGTKNWNVENGIVKHFDTSNDITCEMNCPAIEKFYIYKGNAIFHQKNFIPNSTITLHSFMLVDASPFDFKKTSLSFSRTKILKTAIDATSLIILKAYPYALRGARFKDAFLSNYYKKQPWYRENLQYKKVLTKDDKQWLSSIEIMKHKILRNLPFARRGYIFKDYHLNDFFETRKWYKENKKYIPKPSDLSDNELKWKKKILSKKSIGDKEFFDLIAEYEKILSLEK